MLHAAERNSLIIGNRGMIRHQRLGAIGNQNRRMREVERPDAQLGIAGAAFDRLSYSNKLRHVLAVEGAKSPETRQRRIAKTVSDLQ